MTVGSLALVILLQLLHTVGDTIPLAFITAGYALFQTANNTAVMQAVQLDQRGVISGMLNSSTQSRPHHRLLRDGCRVCHRFRDDHIQSAHALAVATGMRTTFAVSAILTVIALAMAIGAKAMSQDRELGHMAEPPRSLPFPQLHVINLHAPS